MFWSERVWLPPNTTWEQVAPRPDKTIAYTDHRDLLYPLPIAVVLIYLRFFMEKHCFAPIGRYIGVKRTRAKMAEDNPKLEAAYLRSPILKYKQLCVLPKMLDMSERQVARWWRRRRIQDKASPLQKFSENMWRFTFYLSTSIYALYVFWDKKWMWNIEESITGYPNHGLTNDIWWYYMVFIAYYLGLSITQFREARRRDFSQRLVHHFIVIVIMSLSWICNLNRSGSVVLLVHCCVDVFLNAWKAARYAGYQKLGNCLFILFIVVWIITRLYIFPFCILRIAFFRVPMMVPIFPICYMFGFLLCVLQALHLFWTWLIIQVAYKAVCTGKIRGDNRSSCSERSDSSHSDYSYKRKVNKNTGKAAGGKLKLVYHN